MPDTIHYITGNENLLDDIKTLWEALREVHIEKSIHFKERFKNTTYDVRKMEFFKMSQDGSLFIVLAKNEKNENVGYCVSSVVNGVGTIGSIYVIPEYRRKGIASELMERSINRIKKHQPKKVVLQVAVGNEEVLSFYSKFGFYPRLLELEQI